MSQVVRIRCLRSNDSNQSASWQQQKTDALDYYWLKGVLQKMFEAASISGKIIFNNIDAITETELRFPNTTLLLHPLLKTAIFSENLLLGYAGVIHPKTAKNLDLQADTVLFEMNLDPILKNMGSYQKITAPLKTPSIKRDCSILFDETIAWESVEKEVYSCASKILESCALFDVYKGKDCEGKKSVSFTLIFRDSEKTLEDETANLQRDKIVQHLTQKFNAVFRQR